MKKTRGKKVKVNSRKRLSKPASLFKRFFPVFLIVAVFLNIAILFSLDNLTGNVVSVYSEPPAATPSESELNPENVYSEPPAATPSESELNPENVYSEPPAATPSESEIISSNFNFSTPLIAGVAILLVLIVIVFLIRKVRKR